MGISQEDWQVNEELALRPPAPLTGGFDAQMEEGFILVEERILVEVVQRIGKDEEAS